jgi:hypothetical protein
MGKLADNLKDYFENTPKEQLDKDWEEIKHLNDVGVDVIEYAESVRQLLNKCTINMETKSELWKDAQGTDLPDVDREVIAILDNGKVVYAHRPSEHWDGKNIDTGKVTRYYPKTYGKGGWNIPNLKYWLDYPLPE